MILVPILLVASVAVVRAVTSLPGQTRLAVGAEIADLPPRDLMLAAADVLERATEAAGSGYRFDIVQTSTMVAKPDGPRIAVPDPLTRGTLRMADSYYLHALLERGVARPDGFWSQMRAGPAEGRPVDWDGARVMFDALVHAERAWRNDGDGWYPADGLPGIGLDPATAALLPALLRGGEDARDLPAQDPRIDPAAARTLEASAEVAAIPGIIAADGAAFTELSGTLAYGFDAAGRLVSITVRALNTNMTDFELVIATRIAIAYDAVGELPRPDPLRPAEGSN